MKASNAASASLLVSAIQISCSDRLAFGALRQFVEDVGGLMHPAALLACGRPQLAERLPEPKRTVGDGQLGRDDQTSVLQIEQQFTPILRTLACAVGEAEQLLLALRCRADYDQDALFDVFETGLQVNAVGPYVDVALGRQIALPPVLVLGHRQRHSAIRRTPDWW